MVYNFHHGPRADGPLSRVLSQDPATQHEEDEPMALMLSEGDRGWGCSKSCATAATAAPEVLNHRTDQDAEGGGGVANRPGGHQPPVGGGRRGPPQLARCDRLGPGAEGGLPSRTSNLLR